MSEVVGWEGKEEEREEGEGRRKRKGEEGSKDERVREEREK